MGLGGHFGSMVYALSIPLGFMNYTIVHLEILNIVVAANIWATHWSNRKIQVFVTMWHWWSCLPLAKPGTQYWPHVPEPIASLQPCLISVSYSHTSLVS